MNIPLLRQIQQKIQEKPNNFMMGSFFDPYLDYFEGQEDFIKAENCGTAACIAGWAITLAEAKSDKPIEGQCFLEKESLTLGITGQEILKLTLDEASKLFHIDEWPSELEEAYVEAKTQAERVKIACERIDLFIASNGEK